MIEVPAIIYYLLVITVRLRALLYCIVHFNNQKKLVISEQDKEKVKLYRLNKPWRDFERQIADCFSQRGREKILGPGENDNGIDVRIRKNGKIFLIQCKHWYKDRYVHPKQIREFQGAIDRYNKKHNRNAKGIFITTGFTTQKARDEANLLGIHLRDAVNDWQKKVNTFEG